MSRIGKTPIIIPKNIKINILKKKILIFGPLGNINYNIPKFIKIKIYNNLLIFKTIKLNNNLTILGTLRSIIKNIILGLNKKFEKKLILVGLGFKAKMDNNILKLFIGFSHPIFYKIPFDINCEILNQNEILIRGINLQRVGQISSEIRSFRPPEPYKGKGIRYYNEKIKIKEIKKK